MALGSIAHNPSFLAKSGGRVDGALARRGAGAMLAPSTYKNLRKPPWISQFPRM